MAKANAMIDAEVGALRYDEQLSTLNRFGCQLRSGYTSHAPMVIEAMRQLNRVDAIAGWLEIARPDLLERPKPTEPIQWRELQAPHPALSQPERFSDWATFFAGEIATIGWRAAAAMWTERLVDGFASAALHGVIRVGHAVRGLGDRDTSPRRRELADALASWACAYSAFPLSDAALDPRMLPHEVLADLPLIPQSARRNDGSIVAAVGQLPHATGFAEAIATARFDADPHRALSGIGSVFAQVFVAQVSSPLTAVVFTHAITGAAAASHLLRVSNDRLASDLLWRSWQSGCALVAAYAQPADSSERLDTAAAVDAPEDLTDAAIAGGDDHAIKLTEAALFFYAMSADPVLLRAASLGVRTLSVAR